MLRLSQRLCRANATTTRRGYATATGSNPSVSRIVRPVKLRSTESRYRMKPNDDLVTPAKVRSTNEIASELDTLFVRPPEGGCPAGYETRYPNISYERFSSMFEDELRRPFYKSDELFEAGDMLMGFDRRELEHGTAHSLPKLFDERGQLKAAVFSDWMSGLSKERDEEVAMFARLMTEIDTMIADAETAKATPDEDVDEEVLKRDVGRESFAEVKGIVDYAMSRMPQVDGDALAVHVEKRLRELQVFYKDYLIDELDSFKEVNSDLQFLSIFLETDEFGLPKHDFRSFEFWESYFPELVDDVIEEIEHNNWDITYEKAYDTKLLRMGPEAVFSINKDTFGKEFSRLSKELGDEMRVLVSVTEEQRTFQQMYNEVLNVARSNKAIESAISQLRFQLGEAEAEADDSAKKKKKKTDELDAATSAIVDRALEAIMSDRAPAAVKDPRRPMQDKLLREIRNLMAGRNADEDKDDGKAQAAAAAAPDASKAE